MISKKIFFILSSNLQTLFSILQDRHHLPAVISLLQFNLFFPGLQLLIEVGDTGDTPAVNISFRDPQFRIALKTDPVVSESSSKPSYQERFFSFLLFPLTHPSPAYRQAGVGERVTVRDNFVLIAFINYHTITQNRTQWRELKLKQKTIVLFQP